MFVTPEELDEWGKKEKTHHDFVGSRGGGYFRDRIEEVARRCCHAMPGNMIEIGVYSAQTTEHLAKVAREFDRKVIACDNWLPGDSYRLDEVEIVARERMADYADVVDIWKADAHEPHTIERIQKLDLCFGLSDDGHQYAHHYSELTTLLPIMKGGVIAVDDIYFPGVIEAINDALKKHPDWYAIYGDGLREAYLQKKG